MYDVQPQVQKTGGLSRVAIVTAVWQQAPLHFPYVTRVFVMLNAAVPLDSGMR